MRPEVIESFLAGAGGVQHHLAGGGSHGRKTAASDCPARALEGIVAARIDNGQRKASLLLPQVIENALQRHSIIGDLLLALWNQIDRDQVVGALELNSVPRIIKYRFVAAGELLLEAAQRLLERFERQVFLKRHGKTGALQRARYRPRVGSRVLQWRRTLIAVIADDQRQAPRVSARQPAGQYDRQQGGDRPVSLLAQCGPAPGANVDPGLFLYRAV